MTGAAAYAASKKFTQDTADEMGALKGAPCEIKSVDDSIAGQHTVLFGWTSKSGVTQESTMTVYDGEKGDKGATGATGAQGIQGERGVQGIQGIQGAKGDKGDKGNKGDDGYPFLIYKQYDSIDDFDAADFPEVGLMFMVMTAVPEHGYPVYRVTGDTTTPYSFIVYLANEGIKGEKGDKGDKGDTGNPGADGTAGQDGTTYIPEIGTVTTLPAGASATASVTTNSETGKATFNFGIPKGVDGDNAMVYRPAGSTTFANLPSLTTDKVGNVYDVTDAFTTTADFKEGAGKSYPAGTNVVIINTGTDESPVLKYDCLMGDLSSILTDISDIKALVPSTASSSNKLATASDVATKVDKNGTDRLMTASEADKLAGIEAGAEVNVQSDWNESDNTSDAYIQNKPSIPASTSDLQNDSGFITNAVSNLINYYLKSETYNKTEVDSIIAAVKNSRFEFVSTLPTTDIQTNVIYLVPKSSTQTNNAKDEYINLDGTTSGWEKIGDTEIDLSGYVTTAALNAALAEYTTTTNLTTLLNDKQDKTDNTLQTTAKTVIGAINEVFASIATKQSQITQSSLLTLTVAGWDSTTLQQTVSYTHDTTKRNIIDITLGEMTTWGECGVRAVSETATGITFECDTVPETALTFTVTSMEVS